MKYSEFLQNKEVKIKNSGFTIDRGEINKNLFEYQKDIVQWAIKKGKAAIFSDCGTGKTLMQLEYAQKIYEHEHRNVLIIAPLNVVKQTSEIEAGTFEYTVTACRTQSDVKDGINITNYEMLEHFNASEFVGVILDESSILKSFTSKTKEMIIDKFQDTPYKLACTATPSPNDFMELGNHCEFLNIMTRPEMLAEYFIHDGKDTAKWRLKGHAANDFWEWVATWAVCIRKPSDLGYNDDGYELPELNIKSMVLESETHEFELVPMAAETLSERREARKEGLNDRISKVAEMVNNSSEQWLVWCDYNDESEHLRKAIPEGVEVKGSDTPEFKEKSAIDFTKKNIRVLISKPSIFGFGSNWQNCHNVIFCGLSDSYEKFYQALRRCWRYGQKNQVNAYIIITQRETNVLDNIKRKQSQMDEMISGMIGKMRDTTIAQIHHTKRERTEYKPSIEFTLPDFMKGENDGSIT